MPKSFSFSQLVIAIQCLFVQIAIFLVAGILINRFHIRRQIVLHWIGPNVVLDHLNGKQCQSLLTSLFTSAISSAIGSDSSQSHLKKLLLSTLFFPAPFINWTKIELQNLKFLKSHRFLLSLLPHNGRHRALWIIPGPVVLLDDLGVLEIRVGVEVELKNAGKFGSRHFYLQFVTSLDVLKLLNLHFGQIVETFLLLFLKNVADLRVVDELI